MVVVTNIWVDNPTATTEKAPYLRSFFYGIPLLFFLVDDQLFNQSLIGSGYPSHINTGR